MFINEHLAKGYIEESNSPYASPLFFRKKKDGKLHPIMDYRVLNSWMVRDKYPLPLISTILDHLQGKELFTKFDIRWGYENIRIKKEDRWKAAFKTPLGLFQPCVMFFGLTNSPAVKISPRVSQKRLRFGNDVGKREFIKFTKKYHQQLEEECASVGRITVRAMSPPRLADIGVLLQEADIGVLLQEAEEATRD